jgi:hypothetical protein
MSIMSGNLCQQPQQHASKAQRWRPQLFPPVPGLRYDFGMPPHPDIAQYQGHTHKQQPQGGCATAGTDTCLMRLPVRRLNPKPTAIGGANPTPGAMRETPGGI